MREILFRGKRIDNGAWVYGSFLLDGEAHRPLEKKHLSFSKCYIIPETDRDNIKTRFNDGSYYLQTVGYHVIPETVGQFTGMTDKNGKKIFEGDIVKAERICNGLYWTGCVVWWYGCFAIQGIKDSNNVPAIDLFRNYEVIGNIHDNPELLKGGAEDGK